LNVAISAARLTKRDAGNVGKRQAAIPIYNYELEAKQ